MGSKGDEVMFADNEGLVGGDGVLTTSICTVSADNGTPVGKHQFTREYTRD
jgi:hypothetical protein